MEMHVSAMLLRPTRRTCISHKRNDQLRTAHHERRRKCFNTTSFDLVVIFALQAVPIPTQRLATKLVLLACSSQQISSVSSHRLPLPRLPHISCRVILFRCLSHFAVNAEKNPPFFRTVTICDNAKTDMALSMEPCRPGPPPTGPGNITNEVTTSKVRHETARHARFRERRSGNERVAPRTS